MLNVEDPAEVLLARDALLPLKADLIQPLWADAEDRTSPDVKRFRALAALAAFDPGSPRWSATGPVAVERMLSSNPLHLALWMQGFRPARLSLLTPLGDAFRGQMLADYQKTAAVVLADYAADQPEVLAELLMDADEKQFAVLFPKVKARDERGLILLEGEVGKPPLSEPREFFEQTRAIAVGDGKIKTANGKLLQAKLLEVTLQARKTYMMSMNSTDLDSFLVVLDQTGKVLAHDDNSGGNLNALLVYTAPKQEKVKVYAAAIKGTGSFVLTIMESDGDDAKEKLAKRQANAAVALLKMDRPEKVWPLLKHSPDPRLRSYLIHRFAPLGANVRAIVQRLEEESDVTCQRALILSLGDFDDKDWSAGDRKSMTEKLKVIYRTAADPGLHAAAEWLLRHWKQNAWLKEVHKDWVKDKEQCEKRLQSIRAELAKEKGSAKPAWYVNGQGHTMVVIPGPVEFMMGSPPTEARRMVTERQHKKRIGRTFAIAAKSVTMEQFKSFKPVEVILAPTYTRTEDLPFVAMSFYNAMDYCHWLSKEEGIPQDQWCYEANAKGQVTKLKENYLRLSGYRLPTEAEIEYATRAGALTCRPFGESSELLPKYAWSQKNSQEMTWPVGSLKPNDFGLFDILGNAQNWAQGSHAAYPAGQLGEVSDDKEDPSEIASPLSRVQRGGSYGVLSSSVRSAFRFGSAPTSRQFGTGFRVARTIVP